MAINTFAYYDDDGDDEAGGAAAAALCILYSTTVNSGYPSHARAQCSLESVSQGRKGSREGLGGGRGRETDRESVLSRAM